MKWAPPQKIIQSSWMTMTTRIETYGDFGFLKFQEISIWWWSYDDTMIMIIMNYNKNDGNWIGVTIPKWPNFWGWWICKFNHIYDDISIIIRDIYIHIYIYIWYDSFPTIWHTSVVSSNMWDTPKSQLTDLLRPTVGTGQSSVPPNEGQRNFSCCLLRCHNTMIHADSF
jgi:hypothetical protein